MPKKKARSRKARRHKGKEGARSGSHTKHKPRHKKKEEHEHGPRRHAEAKTHHPPLHVQIKTQLSKKKVQEAKKAKKEGEGKPVIHGTKAPAPVKEKKETHQPPKKDRVELMLSGFENRMMRKVEIGGKNGNVVVRISGDFNLEKEVSLTKKELSSTLQVMLPEKINSMNQGEALTLIGLSSEELNDLFKKNIVVEPRGDIEVSEHDVDGKLSLTIKIAEERKPLFEYSQHGKTIEDVKQLVEREKLWMMTKGEGPEEEPHGQKQQEEGKAAPGGDGKDNWLEEQIKNQHREMEKLASEMGESVDPKPQGGKGPASGPGPAMDEAGKADGAGAETAGVGPEEKGGEEGEKKAETDRFIEDYKKEASGHIKKLESLPKLKENPQDAGLIGEIYSSAQHLRETSEAVNLSNISKVAGALEGLFEGYKEAGLIDMEKYDVMKEAVDRIGALYKDLPDGEKEDIGELIKKLESASPG